MGGVGAVENDVTKEACSTVWRKDIPVGDSVWCVFNGEEYFGIFLMGRNLCFSAALLKKELNGHPVER